MLLKKLEFQFLESRKPGWRQRKTGILWVGASFVRPQVGFSSFLENQRFLLARKLENHYSKRLPCSLRELRLRALLRKATSPLLPKTEIPCVNFSFRSPVRLKDWILMPAFCLHFSATRFSCNFKTAFSPPPVS